MGVINMENLGLEMIKTYILNINIILWHDYMVHCEATAG
jgi:hypothetical protein